MAEKKQTARDVIDDIANLLAGLSDDVESLETALNFVLGPETPKISVDTNPKDTPERALVVDVLQNQYEILLGISVRVRNITERLEI